MKKFLLVIGMTLLFALAGCANMRYLVEDNLIVSTHVSLYPPEENTFSRHLQDIRLLTAGERVNSIDNEPSAEAEQLARLHQFAEKLNAGGTAFSDIRVSRIMHSGRTIPVGAWDSGEFKRIAFEIFLLNAEDSADEELFEEMLTFTGIDADNIRVIRSGWHDEHITFTHGYPDFLLANAAVYEIAQPYLRLREFAKEINANTTYYHEVIITSITDYVRDTSFNIHRGFVFPPNYRMNNPLRMTVGVSNHELTQDEELIAEILQVTGLPRSQIRLEVRPIEATYVTYDFLRVNEELAELYRQRERMMEFIDLIAIRSVRRGIVMDSVIHFAFPPSRGAEPFMFWHGCVCGGRHFHVGFTSEEHANNEELLEVILAFTQIPHDEIETQTVALLYTGNQRSASDLTREERLDLRALESYKEEANAPFWYNRYLYDPVILRIRLPHCGHWTRQLGGYYGSSPNFVLYLYDPDLLNLTPEEFAERTATFKEEIKSATGVENLSLAVAPDTLW
ncbi:MAG: hypothetical protein FWC89_01775 [Defluviitaleaceae bacterium]|nr:hypothetical protein [Defluviitaleaceae bacterium]